MPRAPGGGRAPAGLGFGRRGQRRSGDRRWIRKPPEHGGRQDSRRWRGVPAGCAFWKWAGDSWEGRVWCYIVMWEKLKICCSGPIPTATSRQYSLHRSNNKTRGNLAPTRMRTCSIGSSEKKLARSIFRFCLVARVKL